MSRLYYEQASAVFAQYGKGKKKAIEGIISESPLADTNMEICRGKLCTGAVLQLAGFQMSSDVSRTSSTCYTRQRGNADHVFIVPSTEVVLCIEELVFNFFLLLHKRLILASCSLDFILLTGKIESRLDDS